MKYCLSLHSRFSKINMPGSEKKLSLLVMLAIMAGSANAQEIEGKSPASAMSDPFVLTMVIVMIILLLFIGLLANVVTGSAVLYRQRQLSANDETPAGDHETVVILHETTDLKDYQDESKPGNTTGKIITSAILMLSFSKLMAQDTVAASAVIPGGLSSTAFYFMWAVLAVELVVIFILLLMLRTFIRKEQAIVPLKQKTVSYKKALAVLWVKANSFKSQEQEKDIEMHHEYDGIRELDNRLPPWWLYGFYLSIVVAGIYMYRYHISHSAPLPVEELQIAMAKADIEKQEYLKKSANLVDETNVRFLGDAEAVASGKKIFDLNCGACHGSKGEGTVGPNLTDEYWLHGGSISDVFKSIKYGWPEKGMKSWKDDFSPAQMAQLTSFIKTLKGTNPPNAKARQGELFVDSVEAKEPKTDSTLKTETAGILK
jgi:cytochrome c oxidase cbb3-type subunit III